jgi:hypothetical protein
MGLNMGLMVVWNVAFVKKHYVRIGRGVSLKRLIAGNEGFIFGG